MKKIFLSFAIVATGALMSAQETKKMHSKKEVTEAMKQDMAAKKEAKMAKLKADLNLTDAQVAQIKVLKEKQKTERTAEFAKAKADREQKAKAYATKHDEELKTILSAEQFAKWQELKKEHKGERKSSMMKKEGMKKGEMKKGMKREGMKLETANEVKK